jgi:hypothetical protein
MAVVVEALNDGAAITDESDEIITAAQQAELMSNNRGEQGIGHPTDMPPAEWLTQSRAAHRDRSFRAPFELATDDCGLAQMHPQECRAAHSLMLRV